MEKLQRIYRLHHFLNNCRYPVSGKQLQNELECSRATLNRVIQELRLYFSAPIEYDRNLNGYHYLQQNGSRFELPGLWFSPGELLALLTLQQLLEEAQPGLFDMQLAPQRFRNSAQYFPIRIASGFSRAAQNNLPGIADFPGSCSARLSRRARIETENQQSGIDG